MSETKKNNEIENKKELNEEEMKKVDGARVMTNSICPKCGKKTYSPITKRCNSCGFPFCY